MKRRKKLMVGTIKCNTRTPLRLIPNASLSATSGNVSCCVCRFTIRRGAANDYARAAQTKTKKKKREIAREPRGRVRTRRVSDRGAEKHQRDGTTRVPLAARVATAANRGFVPLIPSSPLPVVRLRGRENVPVLVPSPILRHVAPRIAATFKFVDYFSV